jgi:ATP/maltotriose-dependent transcriptional regulator MalT
MTIAKKTHDRAPAIAGLTEVARVCSRFQITLFGRTGPRALCLNAIGAIVGSHVLEPLSQRELEVLELISEGYSNKQIANELGVVITEV